MAATALPSGLSAGTWDIDPARSQIAFTARHFHRGVSGVFTEFSGSIHLADTLTHCWVGTTICTASVRTHRASYDAFVTSRPLLHAATHPMITFVSASLETDDEDCFLGGWLTMHGCTRHIALQVALLEVVTDPQGRTRAEFTARTELFTQDWGIGLTIPILSGLLLGDRVQVEAHIHAVHASTGPETAEAS